MHCSGCAYAPRLADGRCKLCGRVGVDQDAEVAWFRARWEAQREREREANEAQPDGPMKARPDIPWSCGDEGTW